MSEQIKRHGCLTAVLMLVIIANSATAAIFLLNSSLIKQNFLGMPSWVLVVMGISTIFNLMCTVALFQWKKWGFWGLIISCIVALGVNFFIGFGIAQSLSCLVGVILLCAALHMGKENKGWAQLD